jgi:zinc transporter, ZIP family
MYEIFLALSPIQQALCGGLFTWFVTGLGAGLVFFTKNMNQKLLDGMLGAAAGVMIAASFWSLLSPALALSEEMDMIPWIPAASGFLCGGAFLWIANKLLPHLHPGFDDHEVEGLPSTWRRSTLLVSAITLHNIPEGLAIGVAFGAVAHDINGATIGGAMALALGIGIQNFPEGTIVSMPLRREGFSRFKAFMHGQASGMVEPIAAVLGAWFVMVMRPALPFSLSFAAGAMIFVVAEELIPESQRKGDTDLPTVCLMIGFTIMMILDVSLG